VLNFFDFIHCNQTKRLNFVEDKNGHVANSKPVDAAKHKKRKEKIYFLR